MPREDKQIFRQCIACRILKDRNTMVRAVLTPEGSVECDPTGKTEGRGAYLCGEEGCLKKLKKNRLLDRAFSRKVDEAVYAAVEESCFARKG